VANSAATVVFRTCSPQTEDTSFLELPLCSTLRTSHQVAVSNGMDAPTRNGLDVPKWECHQPLERGERPS